MARPTSREIINKKISEGVSKLTPAIVHKLKEVAALDGTIEEMCFYAGISERTYYNWVKDNPELLQEIKLLRVVPILAARRAVIEHMTKNYSNAMDYLSRKRREEFGIKQEYNTGFDPNKINLSEEEKAEIDAIFEMNRKTELVL